MRRKVRYIKCSISCKYLQTNHMIFVMNIFYINHKLQHASLTFCRINIIHLNLMVPFEISYINSVCEFNSKSIETKQQVFSLANSIIKGHIDTPPNYFITATTCPDSLAPSLSQSLCAANHELLGESHSFDLVQGCAGGVSAFILASKLAEENGKNVLIVQSDSAQKATSPQQVYYNIFGNGAFACYLKNSKNGNRLLYSKSIQVKGLEKVVQILLGHDADEYIINHAERVKEDPRFLLGLNMNNELAIELLKSSKAFYNDFVMESESPDALILHQVNPKIIGFLKKYLSDFKGEFIDLSNTIGNCGAATTGIALHQSYPKLKDKKVMICSFGTGGIITAGLWQF